MNDNKILFVDLDGTNKEDLSDLAFYHCLKKSPIKAICVFNCFFI